MSRLDSARNVDLKEKLWQEGVLDMLKSRQEKWKIRTEEMRLERITKKIFGGEMEGKRPRERPRLKWTDNFKNSFASYLLTLLITHYITVFALYYILYLGMASSIGDTSIEE